VRFVLTVTSQNQIEGVGQQAADPHRAAVGVDPVDLADLGPPSFVALDVGQRGIDLIAGRAKVPLVVEAVCRRHPVSPPG